MQESGTNKRPHKKDHFRYLDENNCQCWYLFKSYKSKWREAIRYSFEKNKAPQSINPHIIKLSVFLAVCFLIQWGFCWDQCRQLR